MSKKTFTIYLKKNGKPANNIHVEISSHNDGDYLDNNATMYATGEIVDDYAEYTSKRNWSAAKVFINGRFHDSYSTNVRIDLWNHFSSKNPHILICGFYFYKNF